jgi:hypothetical protein
VKLPVTNAPRCVICKAKTLGLQPLQLPGMTASSGHADQACIVHHRTDELTINSTPFRVGRPLLLLRKEPSTPRSLSCLSCYLVDVSDPGQLCIKGHPKIQCCIDSLYWLCEKLDWSGLLDASRSLGKEYWQYSLRRYQQSSNVVATNKICQDKSPDN